jgi:aspartate-semialdehyde dehydrogenase
MASARSAGQKSRHRGASRDRGPRLADPQGSTSPSSRQGATAAGSRPRFAAAGVVVVDNSSAFRMDPDVPLVVANVNDHALGDRHRGIIANPNCTTMALMMAIGPLHRAAGTDFDGGHLISVGVGLRAAGHGRTAPPDRVLIDKDRTPCSTVAGRTRAGPLSAAHRVQRPPLRGHRDEQGYTDEEWKLVNETRKILGAPDVHGWNRRVSGSR